MTARVKNHVIEYKLKIYFPSEEPAKFWHRLFDLLSVRYFLLVTEGPHRVKVRERNAGPDHSGLSVEQLNQPTLLLETIRVATNEAISAVWRHKLDVESSHLDAAKALPSNWK